MLRFFRRIRRRLFESGKTRSYALYAIGEIALVMIGILLALQVNNWNENKKDRAIEQKTLSGLKENLELNVGQIKWHLSLIETSNKSSQIIFSFLDISRVDIDTMAKHWGNAIRNHGNLIISETGYESLKDIGFQIISDEALKKEVLNLYEFTYLNLFKRLKWSEEVRPEFDRFITEHFLRQGGGGIAPRDLRFVSNSHYFYGLLDVARGQRHFNRSSYEEALSETQRVLRLIKEELSAD